MIKTQKTYLGYQTSIVRNGGLYIAGDPQVGGVLTASNADAVQWMADGVDIAGATALTYTVVTGDVGKRITARSTSGTIETSNALTALAAVTAPLVTLPPLVVGVPTVGVPLSINAATFSGSTATVERTIYGSSEPSSQILARGPLASTGYTPSATDASRCFVVVDEASNAAGSVRATSPRSAWVPIPSAPTPSSGLPVAPVGAPVSVYTTAARSLPAGMTDNTADPYPGTASSVTANFGSSVQSPKDIRPLDINASVIDLRNGLVSFAVKLRPSGTLANGILNLGTCYVNLYNDADPAATKTNYMRANFGSLSVNETFTGEWQIFRVPVEAFVVVGTIPDTAAYLQSVRYGGLQFVHSVNNADSFQVSVGTFNNVPKGLTKGVVVLGFDDCRRDTYAYAYAKMKAYGFPGVLYPGAINATLDLNDTSFMNTANLLEMQADGWQIAYQAPSSESPTSTVPEFDAEMRGLPAFYASKGFNGPLDGSYFSNVNFGSVYQSVFDSKFRSMRGFRQFNDATLPRPEPIPVSRPNFINAYGVNTASNTATNGMIPYATRAGQWKSAAIFVWHGLGSGDVKHSVDGGTLTGFEKLLEWLNSPEGRATVDVVTWDEAVRRWRAGTA